MSNGSHSMLSKKPLMSRSSTQSRVKLISNKQGVSYLEKVVDWVSSLSFPELVRAIYAKYPQYKANSVFTG